MRSPKLAVITAVVLALAGAALIWANGGREIYGRTAKLISHLDTTGWPAADSTDPIMRSLQKQYGTSEWMLHVVTPTSPALPLDPLSIEETFRRIGHAIPARQGHFSIRSQDLPSAYAAFLSDQISSLTLGDLTQSADDRELWQRLIGAIDGSDFEDRSSSLEGMRRAVQRLPEPHPLRSHVQEFMLLSEDFGRYAPALDVVASPAYADPSRWEARALRDNGTLGRCRGYVAPISEESVQFSAEIFVFPRIASLQIRRPWMREDLVDSGLAAAPKANAFRYFGEDGSLRLIPSLVWIQVEDEIQFLVEEEARGAVERLIDQSDCCVAICRSDRTVVKAPAAYREVGERLSESRDKGWFVGLQNGQEPIIYAVISRRRTAGVR